MRAECFKAVGLWEGAFYQETGFYRPVDECRMRDSSREFCPVCRDYLLGKLGAHGTQADCN